MSSASRRTKRPQNYRMNSRKSVKKILPAILFLSFLGLLVSFLIIRIHYWISINPGEMSYCHLTVVLDCDAVLASPYAKIGPFFIAELAFAYYLVLTGGLLLVWGAKKPLSFLSFLFLLTALSTVSGIVLGFFIIIKLGVVCPLCLLAAALNLIILILLPLEMKTPLRELPGIIKSKLFLSPKSLFNHGLFALLIFGLGILMARRLNPQAKYSFDLSPEVYLKDFYALPQNEGLLPERPALGNSHGQVTILAFSDLQCPACRQAEKVLNPILKDYKDRIRLVYLNFPLNPDCNPNVSRTKHHLMGCLAAKQSLCAQQHGKISEYHDWALENRSGYISATDLADLLGVDRSSFENCLVSEKTTALLKQDIETAIKLDVQGIPSFLINGRRFRDWRSAERLRLVLEAELSKTTRN